METADEPLAAFLRDPDGAAAAYVTWLQRRSDHRAEYLSLLTTLDSPADANAAGEHRLRLRALREQVDDAWATAVDGTRLRSSGVYQTDAMIEAAADVRQPRRNLLRFDPDGVVLDTSSAEPAARVWPTFHREEDERLLGRWNLRADQLSFHIHIGSMRMMDPDKISIRWSGDEEGWRELVERHNAECIAQRCEYAGVVGPQTLALRWHSSLNNNSGVRIYRFVQTPVQPERAAEESA